MDQNLIDTNENCKNRNIKKERELNNNKNNYEDVESFYNEHKTNGDHNFVNRINSSIDVETTEATNGFSAMDGGSTIQACYDNDAEEDQNSENKSDSARSPKNISFHNEGLIEEIILLPNNIISDDELSSNSDDCVYAYRGGINVEEPEPQLPCDDETDFLEMDFDPEPNSEVENFNETEHFNHLESNFFSLRPVEEVLRELPSVSELKNKYYSPDERLNEEIERQNGYTETVNQNIQVREIPTKSSNYTGAKPKLINSNSSNHLSNVETPNNVETKYLTNEPSSSDSCVKKKLTSHEDHTHFCLECAEFELIQQTKPNLTIEIKCVQCKNKSAKISDNNLPSKINVDHSLDTTLLQPITTSKPNSSCSMNKECMVTIYSVNCDYQTIVEAANLIGVSMNTTILKHYFDNLIDEETATMSIPEYLLYISKRNCNYKKLIEVIRSACLDPIDIHFYPHYDSFATVPNVVQISTKEITSRWNPNTDLRQILKFKNKNFRVMNVLGKVVYAIRQSDRSKNYCALINIPQYYKSGYICITRMSPHNSSLSFKSYRNEADDV